MRVLVCGSRDWTDGVAIRRRLAGLPAGGVVISGGARGADSLAAVAARSLGLRLEVYSANWRRYGLAAGPIRNQEMLDVGAPDEVWAFHENLSQSKGTADTVRRARGAGVPVRVFTE